jgi:uncharacterized protein
MDQYGSLPRQTPQKQAAQNRPMPRITPLNKPFWDYARQSIFALQTCNACGDAHIPESPICPVCLGDDQSWQPSSGKGTLESWADFHRAYWDGFKDDLPYRTCLVRLDEGPLLISNLVGDQEGVAIGARVEVVFEPVNDEIVLPKFALSKSGRARVPPDGG